MQLSNKVVIKDAFDLKTVTYLIGSPDEIANALVNEKTRSLWDPNLKSVQRNNQDVIQLNYGTLTETV